MIPRTINVLGREYKIRRKRMKFWAYVDDDAATIWLRSGLSGDVAAQTLLHELIHAIMFRSGNKFQLNPELEESIVRALEHGIHQAGYRLM
jgi:predicted mannosyl-3-phosphoglycerate phosphatase (HAD superfamily)